MINFNKIKNQSGMSLLEVMVAGAMAIGIALGIAKMGQNASKSATKMKTDNEIADFKNYIKTNFARSMNCTNTFEDLHINMKTPNGSTNSDTLNVPGVSSIPEYYLFSGGASLDVVTNVDLTPPRDDPGYGVTTGSLTLTTDSPIKGYPNWVLEEVRLYQMADASGGGDGNADTGICPIYFKVKRQAGLNSKRTFGASELNFFINVSCAVHPVGSTEGVAGEMAHCQENQAVVPGYWVLKDKTIPNIGIEYGLDVYMGQDVIVGRHVIIESDERIKKNEVIIDSASEKLENINGFYYFLRADEFPQKSYSQERQLGLMAQEVERIFPEAVSTQRDGTKAVRYTMLIPVLIEAHKEQEKKINSLEKKLNNLIEKLEK
ncbi:MAG: type II secretory pathway pseudopilin PulG [Bacteriovoracaceae bacterium]|jgi:type II secretory pathway pseudopilin PulG